MNTRVIGVITILLLSSCNQRDAHKEGVSINSSVSSSNDKSRSIEVELRNASATVLKFPEAPLLGYPITKPGISLVVFNGGERVEPCAHVALPPAVNTYSLRPGEIFRRSVDINLVRRIYCLEPGSYQAAIEYSNGAGIEVQGELVEFDLFVEVQ